MKTTAYGEEAQILAVLEALESDSSHTQRQLSKETGLNLAKVNFLLRRLADKGMVKLNNVSRNPNKLRYLYLLTPSGMSEKARLTYRFMGRTLNQYRQMEERVRNGLEMLVRNGSSRVVVVGSGEIARIFIDAVEEVEGLELAGVVDTGSGSPDNGRFRLVEPGKLDSMDIDNVVIADVEYAQDLVAACERLGVKKEQLWAL